VHPLLSPLEAFERGAYPQVGEQLLPFFRDVNDHLSWFSAYGPGLLVRGMASGAMVGPGERRSSVNRAMESTPCW
jgi:hypothetical protein